MDLVFQIKVRRLSDLNLRKTDDKAGRDDQRLKHNSIFLLVSCLWLLEYQDVCLPLFQKWKEARLLFRVQEEPD